MNPVPLHARCWAEVDLAALARNVGVVRECAGPDADILAIVKADAYGHGMIPVARALAATGKVAAFGVANVAEASQLRDGLPEAKITLLSPALPTERQDVVRLGLRPWVSSMAEVLDYARLAVEVRGPAGLPFDLEIKVDTGMGRMGVLEEGFDSLRRAVMRLRALHLGGVVTHLPSADEDEKFTTEQLRRFDLFRDRVPPGANFHAQNSAGLIGFARDGRTMVRPGLMLYGASPVPTFKKRLRPVLALKTRVTLVRELPPGRGVSYGRTFVTPRAMRVGTLAAGYADGYPRHLSNAGTEVLVRGRRCPLLGRVTMDQIMIDLSALPEVDAGEEVALIGRQGAEEITAAELAAKAGTVPWEIFTGLTTRVTRVYQG